MADRERDKGKRKMPWHEECGELSSDSDGEVLWYEGIGESSSDGEARRVRARTTGSPRGQDGITLVLLDPRDDAIRTCPGPQHQPSTTQGVGEGGGRVGQQTQDLTSQIASCLSSLQLQQHQEGGVVIDMDLDRGSRTSSPPLPQQQGPSSAQGSVQESDIVTLQMQHVKSQVPQILSEMRAFLNANGYEGSAAGVRNPDTFMPPPASVGTPLSPSQMNLCQPVATASQRSAATGASGPGQPKPATDAGQQFFGNPFRPWMPSPSADDTDCHHDLQVSADKRCPGCTYFPGPLETEPEVHTCLCDVCRLLPFICPICYSKSK